MKKKITNTEALSALEKLWVGMPDKGEGIIAQEKRGQQELVRAQQLPRTVERGKDARQAYKNMGIKVLNTDDQSDELFYNVRLPIGWKLKPSEHDMWSYLYDDQGRKRIAVFYKAAFYDRRADIRLENRYSINFVTSLPTEQRGRYEVQEVKRRNPNYTSNPSYYARSENPFYIVTKENVWIPKYPDHDNECQNTPIWYEILDGNQVIYSTKESPVLPTDLKDPKYHDGFFGADKLREEIRSEAEAWLTERFPDWKDPLAYWD